MVNGRIEEVLVPESVLPFKINKDNLKDTNDVADNAGENGRMRKALKFADTLVMKPENNGKWTFVEIYKYRLVHRNAKGDVKRIYRIDEEGNIK